MPWPATTYMRRAMTTSRQPSPRPQANGTAATSARNGTATNTARATFSHPALLSGSRTGSAARAEAGAGAALGATAVGALGGGVMAILACRGGSGGGTGYATVTYAAVALST